MISETADQQHDKPLKRHIDGKIQLSMNSKLSILNVKLFICSGSDNHVVNDPYSM